MLAWCPGLMTRRYIAGERARFISPVALYLFTVFAMFAVLNFTGALSPRQEHEGRPQTEIADDQRQLAKLEAKRGVAAAAARMSPTSTAGSPRRSKISRNAKGARAARHSPSPTPATRRPAGSAPSSRTSQENPDMVSMKVKSAAIEIQLAADPAVGALHVAAVPVPPPLQHLRPRGLRDLLAVFMMMLVIAAASLVGRRPVGLGGPAVLRAAVPHVPAP